MDQAAIATQLAGILAYAGASYRLGAGGPVFAAVIGTESRPDGMGGETTDTVLTAARAAFTALPEPGAIVTDIVSEDAWRIADIRPLASGLISIRLSGQMR